MNHVRAERSGPVATITLDSPANANALSSGLVGQLRAELDGALADPAVRVIVLTGAGRVFCSGADLTEALTGPATTAGLLPGVIGALWESTKPVVCRVNGSARAGGIGLVAACDIAIAPVTATFAFSEVRIGVAPAIISVPCLRRMPSRAAAEYFLTGETFDAARAVAIGLLTRAVPVEDLDGEVERYVAMLLRGAPGALGATKKLLSEVPAASFEDGLKRMSELSARLFAGAEAREGMTAFAEKRDPAWRADT
jgi:methylglutaconyl-CoA hydratase